MISLSDRIISNTHTYYSIGQILDMLQESELKCCFTINGAKSGISIMRNLDCSIVDFCFDLSIDSEAEYFYKLKAFIEHELSFNNIQDEYYL